MMAHPDKVFFCGQLGNGAAAKISNNYLSSTFLLSIAEAFAIGIKNGLDKHVLANVIRASSGYSWMGENMHPVPDVIPKAPSSHGYKVGFRHELMVKDTTLGIEAAKKHGIEPRMANTAVRAYQKASTDARTKVILFVLGRDRWLTESSRKWMRLVCSSSSWKANDLVASSRIHSRVKHVIAKPELFHLVRHRTVCHCTRGTLVPMRATTSIAERVSSVLV